MDAKKKRRSRLWLLPVLTVLAGTLIGVAIGKYIKTEQYSGTLQFQADLAEDFRLLEHKAVRQPDGSYTLGSETVQKNEYILIPGLDIPKDPHVVIENKTSIAAYLFVEVVDETANSAIGYSMRGDWLLLDGVIGKKDNGAVYVYAADGANPTPLTRTVGTITLYLLQNNEIKVSQKLLASETNDTLKFYAAMGEVNAVTDGTAIENAKEIYNSHISHIIG